MVDGELPLPGTEAGADFVKIGIGAAVPSASPDRASTAAGRGSAIEVWSPHLCAETGICMYICSDGTASLALAVGADSS